MKLLFLDRDGVINVDRPDFVRTWEEFIFLPGVKAALARLKAAGWKLIVVSNQSLLGRGLCPPAQVEAVNRRMAEELAQAGAELDGLYVCPHAPADHCACRKPKPGLIHRAAQELGLDLARAWLVGDAGRDILAGQAAGVKTILVRTGRGAETEKDDALRPDLVLDDLAAVAEFLLNHE